MTDGKPDGQYFPLGLCGSISEHDESFPQFACFTAQPGWFPARSKMMFDGTGPNNKPPGWAKNLPHQN